MQSRKRPFGKIIPRLRILVFLAAFVALVAGLSLAPPAEAVIGVPDGDVAALITAINDANADPGLNTIDLAAGGMYTLTAVEDTSDGDNGLPSIVTEIVIAGNGATIYRGGAATPDFRIFHVDEDGDLTLDDLTVKGGIASGSRDGGGIYNRGILDIVNNSVITENQTRDADAGYTGNSSACSTSSSCAGDDSGDGAAIYNNDGTVTINYSTISNNRTGDGGAGGSDGTCDGEGSCEGGRSGDAGAIRNDGDPAILNISHSAITGNRTGPGGNGGDATCSGSDSCNAGRSGAGGAIDAEDNGTVTIEDSTITGNFTGAGGKGGGTGACLGGGSCEGGDSGDGGGVSNDDDGTVTVEDTTISGNSTGDGGDGGDGTECGDSSCRGGDAGNGGGFLNDGDGTVNLTTSTVSGNSTGNGGNGGSGSCANVDSCNGGDGGNGGGLYNDDVGPLNVTTSTISGNSTGNGGNGGSVCLGVDSCLGGDGGNGGGILNEDDDSVASIVNSTITDNSVGAAGLAGTGDCTATGACVAGLGGLGGGIFNEDVTGTLGLTNTIVANQQSGADCGGPSAITSNDFNLDSDGTCGLGGTNDMSGTDPLLKALAANGGPTETHALMHNSPAIDAGSCSGFTADQRGFDRPKDFNSTSVDDECDFGAFELNGPIAAGHWPLDELVLGTVYDFSKNGNNGSHIDSPTPGVPGIVDEALELTSNGQGVNIPSSASLDDAYNLSVLFCFTADDLGQGEKGRIFVKEDSIKINFSSQDEIIYATFERWSGKTAKYRWHTGENLDNGDSYCGAVTYSYGDPSNEPELVLNGVLVTDRDTMRGPTGTVESDAGTDIFLGNSEGLNRTFDGVLDDFYFFDSILTLEEIQDLQ